MKFCKHKHCIHRSCRNHWINRKFDNVLLIDMRYTPTCKLKSEQPKEVVKDDEDAYKRKKVICIETEIIYDSAKSAAEEVGVSSLAIRKCCRGELASVAGYTWSYT